MTDILTRPSITEGRRDGDTDGRIPRPPDNKGRRAAGVLLAAVLATATAYLAQQALAGEGTLRTTDNSSEVAEHQRHSRLAPTADASFDQAELGRMLRLAPDDPFLQAEYRRQSSLAKGDDNLLDTSHEEAEAQRMERLNPQDS